LSSDPLQIQVPPNVSIPAGQTNASFDLTVFDDGIRDGTRAIVISAGAPQYISASRVISIRDNELATLTLSFASSASETIGTIPAMLSVSGNVGADVSVSLSSS